jgi:diguanylate cyclase (GGDEF)-like protein
VIVEIIIFITFLLCVGIIFFFILKKYKYKIEKAKEIEYLQTIRELNILNEYASSLNTVLYKEEVFDIIVDKIKELLKAERSAIILVNGDKVVDFYTSLGPTGECKVELDGTLNRVIKELTTIRSDDISREKDFNGFPTQHPEIKSILMVPMLLRGEPIGIMIAADKSGPSGFSSKDEDLLLNLAFHAAYAIEKVSFYEEIIKKASTDGLTGLFNHRTFQERLKEEIERAKRFGHSVSLLMMDIDRFKNFNDAFGHLIGDEMLKSIADIIKNNIRSIDIAARYGGEEFAVILPEIDLKGALIVAERIRKKVEVFKIPMDDKERGVTISIGVVTFPEDASTRELLIDRADKALYLAKRTGRNRVCSFREELNSEFYKH